VKEVPSLIDDSNGALHDYEVRYSEGRVPFSSAATETHLFRAGCARARSDQINPEGGAEMTERDITMLCIGYLIGVVLQRLCEWEKRRRK
jgi:hypothetical protein